MFTTLAMHSEIKEEMMHLFSEFWKIVGDACFDQSSHPRSSRDKDMHLECNILAAVAQIMKLDDPLFQKHKVAPFLHRILSKGTEDFLHMSSLLVRILKVMLTCLDGAALVRNEFQCRVI